MTSLIEIHTLIEELNTKKASDFFVYNEMKNILLDQPNFSEMQELIQRLLKGLTDEQKQQAIIFLSTTTNATLNRYVL